MNSLSSHIKSLNELMRLEASCIATYRLEMEGADDMPIVIPVS